MSIIWLLLAILLFILEVIVPNLALVWFGVGALVSMLLAYLSVGLEWQVIVFMMVSGALFIVYTRKFAIDKSSAFTSVMSVEGEVKGVVLSEITENGIGQVKVKGLEWSAKSVDGKRIEVGKQIEVLKEGVVLVVKEVII